MDFITSTGENISLKKELFSLLEILQPTIKELNYQDYIDYLQQMLNQGNSSVRQLKVYSKYKSLKKIAQFNAYECKASFTRNINCITKYNKEINFES
jgi:gamma-glutamyl:cysteine ligase YbdK (ATP-grasp superfamily)